MRTPARKDRDDQFTPPEGWEEGELASRERPEMRLPMIAIVGRPNVGKSTLFNRIIGRRKALVHDRPGVTRDRNIDRAEWDGVPFLCVDTGGFEIELDDPLLTSVVEQVRMAVDEADAIIFLAAVHETAHPADLEIIRLLRGADKPVFAAINKCDTPALVLEANDFYRHGFENIYPVSALHGAGTADLLADVLDFLRRMEQPARHVAGEGSISMAIVGRQNVGKSTLVNQLCGAQRVIAADLPGTTRDAIDTYVTAPSGRRFALIDTAGIRRRGKIEVGVERISVLSSMMSLERADVAALLIDAVQGPTEQDAHIAGYCVDAGVAMMILVNKWDALEKDGRTADEFTHWLEENWKFLRHAPVLYISAKSGLRAHRVFEVAERIHANACRRISTHELNERLEQWVGRKPPTMSRNRRPKVRFMTQSAIQPPTFTMFVNDPMLFHFSYKRYITNRLREAYDFEGTPIRLDLRQNRTRKEDDVEIEKD
jgi:GTP-binding protein